MDITHGMGSKTCQNMVLIVTLLYTGEAIMAPPINFEASQLQQEGLVWSNLHINLVTWVPTMTKTQKMFQNLNSVLAMQVVTK